MQITHLRTFMSRIEMEINLNLYQLYKMSSIDKELSVATEGFYSIKYG